MEINQLLYYKKNKQSTDYNLSKIGVAVAALTTTLMVKWLYDTSVPKVSSACHTNLVKPLMLYNYKNRDNKIFPFTQTQSDRSYDTTLAVPKEKITYIGLYQPEPLLPHEITKIQQFENVRNKYLNLQTDLEMAHLEQETKKSLRAANNAISKHMRPDDLAAVLKEERGIKIFRKTGGTYNHCLEVMQANNAIKKSMLEVERKIMQFRRASKYNTKIINILSKQLYQLSKFEDNYKFFVKGIKCIAKLRY